uniref:LRRNT domain-containing protein n=1 Tax=Athene cunicularia TaxID=194338 RepID=A0A663N2T4_ATHCN
MWVPALLLLITPVLLPPAGTTDPDQLCPSEMNKVKDILEVNCTGQTLSAVPPDLPADTGILLLSTNRLTSVSTAAFLNLKQLQDLDLSHNGLVDLDTNIPLPSLRELILSHNALGALPVLEGLPMLTRLAVAHNSLTQLRPGAFQGMSQLKDLDLRGNQLRTLPEDVFAGLNALEDLDLSDNLLEQLPKDLLQDLKKLVTLWLSGNRLRALPSEFFPEGHLFMYVFLTENPWHYVLNWSVTVWGCRSYFAFYAPTASVWVMHIKTRCAFNSVPGCQSQNKYSLPEFQTGASFISLDPPQSWQGTVNGETVFSTGNCEDRKAHLHLIMRDPPLGD